MARVHPASPADPVVVHRRLGSWTGLGAMLEPDKLDIIAGTNMGTSRFRRKPRVQGCIPKIGDIAHA
jgi:hypothetical protein